MPLMGRPGAYPCHVCGGTQKYVASSDDYHRYECKNCGAKLLVPKEEK